VKIDFQGSGTWHRYKSVTVPVSGYAKLLFPDAFSAHWVRLAPQTDVTATASFFFT
jgi:hypothetical protein